MPLLVWWATDVCMNANCFSSQLPSIDLRTDALYTPLSEVITSLSTPTPLQSALLIPRHHPVVIAPQNIYLLWNKLTNQVSESWWKHSGWRRLWGTSVNAKCVGPLQRLASTMGQSLATNAKHSSGQEKFVICCHKNFHHVGCITANFRMGFERSNLQASEIQTIR